MNLQRFVGITSVAAVIALNLAGCEGNSRPFEEAVEVRTANLRSLSVTPPSMSVDELVISPGQAVQFSVQGRNTAGETVALSASDRQWTVSDASVAGIDSDGRLVGYANGDVSVAISIGGLESTAYALRVSDAVLTAIQEIKGAALIERCRPQDYRATGLYDDGTVRDLVGLGWNLAQVDTANARIEINADSTATLTGLNSGVVQLTATLGSLNPLSSPVEIADTLTGITISPATATVVVDQTQNFTAFGTYATDISPPAAPAEPAAETAATTTSASGRVDITDAADWQVADPNIAKVSNKGDTRGQLTGVGSGSTTLTAGCGDVSDARVVTVSSSSNPDSTTAMSFEAGDTLRLSRNGGPFTLNVSTGTVYSSLNRLNNDDLTWSLVTGSSLTPAIVLGTDSTEAGVIQPVAEGQATVTATRASGGSASITITVTNN
jgi:hypothetical protein